MSEIYLGKDEIYIFLKRDTQRDHNLAWYAELIKLKISTNKLLLIRIGKKRISVKQKR
jgi:hypothetical protein